MSLGGCVRNAGDAGGGGFGRPGTVGDDSRVYHSQAPDAGRFLRFGVTPWPRTGVPGRWVFSPWVRLNYSNQAVADEGGLGPPLLSPLPPPFLRFPLPHAVCGVICFAPCLHFRPTPTSGGGFFFPLPHRVKFKELCYSF